MKQIKVEIVIAPNYNPVSMIAGLARLTQVKKEFVLPEPTQAAIDLMRSLDSMNHTSLFESSDFGVVIHGASRVFLAQITRHRVASYMSGSQQYQLHHDFPYVTPTEIEGTSMEVAYHEYMKLAAELYTNLELQVGRDVARYVLPNAARNHLFMKANAREWIYAVFPQRMCRRNTPESFEIMKAIFREFHGAGYGELFNPEICGPACMTRGVCDQGKMACGKPLTVKEIFGEPLFVKGDPCPECGTPMLRSQADKNMLACPGCPFTAKVGAHAKTTSG